jgi:hypothetical protein
MTIAFILAIAAHVPCLQAAEFGELNGLDPHAVLEACDAERATLAAETACVGYPTAWTVPREWSATFRTQAFCSDAAGNTVVQVY